MLTVTCSLMEKLKEPILVIDDDPGSLFFLRFCLSRQGFSVDVASSGDNGIEKIKNKTYSAVLTSIRMEPVSGFHVAAFLQSVLKKVTPIIGISGIPCPIGLDDFDAVLYRPFSTQDVLRVLHGAVDIFFVKGNCY
ncbi:response regulator [Desulfobacter vibrioformis]|uniref:response regulator n=1 Tax=Desulfobacter vibrioformis TaxID=34031 RepID=UPI0012EC795C|nr:response regulator [Desulfobacter vibrioformis]